MSLKGKKILITAGPTWVAVDDVRVISNISSGEFGLFLAQEAWRLSLETDLFLGPVGRVKITNTISLFRFRYFKDLLNLVCTKLKKNRYDIILHTAAVSDYLMDKFDGKISSQKEKLILTLKRAPKIIKTIRRLAPKAFLVMFKLESAVSDAVLLKRALTAMKKEKADLAVANRIVNGKYRGFILGSPNILAKTTSKPALAKRLFEILQEKVH